MMLRYVNGLRAIIGLGNGESPVWCQARADLLSTYTPVAPFTNMVQL